jgi:hypothetical protein
MEKFPAVGFEIRSTDTVGQGEPHSGTGLERAEDRYRLDRRTRQFRRHIVRDACQPDDLHLQALARRHRTLEISSAVVLQADRQRAACQRLFDAVGMQGELVRTAVLTKSDRFE